MQRLEGQLNLGGQGRRFSLVISLKHEHEIAKLDIRRISDKSSGGVVEELAKTESNQLMGRGSAAECLKKQVAIGFAKL